MHMSCVFSASSCRVGASQISVIIIITKQRRRPLWSQPHPVLDSYPAPRLASFQVGQLGPSERSGAGTAMSH